MKIAFHDPGPLDYTPDTPYHRPLGGTESATAYLSAALAARGHEVALINRSTQIGRFRGVDVIGFDACRARILNCFDVVVCLTKPVGATFRRGGVSVPMVIWQHMHANHDSLAPLHDKEEKDAWSHCVYVSDFQRCEFLSIYGMEGVTLRNASSPSALSVTPSVKTFIERGDDPVLIYASAPGRGLDTLLAAFAAAREKLPGLKLRICSDGGIYHHRIENDGHGAIYALARALPGVDFTGSMAQPDLAQQFAQADLLAYPARFIETSCIVAMEAASAGCVLLAADLGALSETMAGFGIFMPFEESRAIMMHKFAELIISSVASARAHPDSFQEHRAKQIAWFRATHSWEKRAEEWESWLKRAVVGR